MMKELWTPTRTHQRTAAPDTRKVEGGSWFDDELPSQESVDKEFANEMERFILHLNARPDHAVYVSSVEERDKMRIVFNDYKRRGWIGHNPHIRIEYGLADGAIRVAE